MMTAREIDIKLKPLRRFNYPDDWFQRETRSRRNNSKSWSSINQVLIKKREDPRDIMTPRNCREALSKDNDHCEEWREAINKEMGTIISMEVFEYISPEEAKKVRAFKSRWGFKVKIEADGSVTFKARLVVKGFSQKYGLDYDETYAPTITFGTILMILHIAGTLVWHITGCDIGNAYLEALTNRDLYMELPADYTGFDDNGNVRRVIVRLRKNLYGSKQAALMWYSLISEVLCRRGFKRSRYEPCCFILDPNGCIDDAYVIVCVYVDDLLITGPSAKQAESIKQYLAESFQKIKDL
jgi:hypothetical protein